MTAIHQQTLANHQTIDDKSHHSENRNIGSNVHGRQISDDSANDSGSGTVNISFHAHMRLRAYQDQKVQSSAETDLKPVNSLTVPGSDQRDVTAEYSADTVNNNSDGLAIPPGGSANKNFSEQMTNMLSEVENNIVQTSEPGYRYLLNVLDNYKATVEDPQQLQEIMRKEEFYLNRRKPFMESADFQSYSQVLSQFSNIIDRQQYAS